MLDSTPEEIKKELPLYGKRNKSYAMAVHFDNFNPDNYLIIDIRNPIDYRSRHLPNAQNITDYEQLCALIKSNPDSKILLQCYSGHTVAELGSHLVLQGYQNIYFLDELIDDFWENSR